MRHGVNVAAQCEAERFGHVARIAFGAYGNFVGASSFKRYDRAYEPIVRTAIATAKGGVVVVVVLPRLAVVVIVGHGERIEVGRCVELERREILRGQTACRKEGEAAKQCLKVMCCHEICCL